MSTAQVQAKAVRLASVWDSLGPGLLTGSEVAAPAPDRGVEEVGGADARLPTSRCALTCSARVASEALSTARPGGRDALLQVQELRHSEATCPPSSAGGSQRGPPGLLVGRPGLSLTPESQWVTEGGVGIGIF